MSLVRRIEAIERKYRETQGDKRAITLSDGRIVYMTPQQHCEHMTMEGKKIQARFLDVIAGAGIQLQNNESKAFAFCRAAGITMADFKRWIGEKAVSHECK